MSAPAPPAAPASSAASWWADGAIAAALLVGMLLLRPAMPDGDGLGHADRAVHRTLLSGMEAKHILYAPLLRCVLLLLEPLGLRPYALEAFTVVSNLAGVAIYLLLARAVFAPLLGDVGLARLCALGSVLSFGVLSRCCAIETYALALALAVGLAALCVRGLTTAGRGAAAGLVFVLAVGVHATNVLTLPFVLALLWAERRRGGWAAAGAFAAVVAAGAAALAAALAFGGEGGPSWARLLPKADPQPAMGIGGRVSRAAYGVARTAAWLSPVRDLLDWLQADRGWALAFAVSYAAAFLLAAALLVAVARRGFFRNLGRYRAAFLPLALLAVPFVAIGVWYFPSDPERWLFLVPVFWLLVGRVWADDAPGPRAWLSRPTARILLAALVAALAVYNGAFKLWPEARHDRSREGVAELARLAGPDDLVVALGGFNLVDEFVLHQPPFAFEVLPIDQLMMQEHPNDIEAARRELRRRITAALAQKRRVFVHGLIGEGHRAEYGYPWAHVKYRPEDLLSVLEEFRPEERVKPDAAHTGTYELRGP
jgi:hypothetical protein